MAISINESNWITLAPGQTRSILQGSPEFLNPSTFNGITVTLRPVFPAVQVYLEGTYVSRDAAGNVRVGYTVRNADPNVSVEFKRTTVSIDPL